jgi:protein-L-isoaspartate(D-aspartate) O-methyltransferase
MSLSLRWEQVRAIWRHKVLSFEINADIARFAQANLKSANVANVQVRHADAAASAEQAQFKGADVIVLSGSVEFIPEWLLQSLNIGGRLSAIVGQSPVMTAEIHTRVSQNDFKTEILFETDTPALQTFAKKTRFTF